MTGTVAYILARKIALGAVSGIKNLSFSGNTIIFNFNDGTSASMVVPLPKDGKDGVSVTNVEINDAKHLICTMSDNSTIDAGELPGGTGGGLVQVKNKAALPAVGVDNTLYLTKDDDILYYWDDKDKLYRPVTGGSGANGIDFKTSNIEFDGIESTFDLPIDDKKVSIFINGMYLTEDEDYTIDRTVIPNTVTFLELWEEEDLCTVVWVKGTVDESSGSTEIGIPQLKTEIKDIFNAFAYILETDITSPWPTTLTLAGSKMRNVTSTSQKELIKVPYIVDKDNKIVGCGFVTGYNNTTDEFTIVLTKYGEGGSSIDNASLATKKDIDKLFTNIPDIDTSNSTLATKEDIDKLFSNLGDITTPSQDIYATKDDIDNLFQGNGTIDPDTSSLATKQDIDKLFS